MKTLKMVLIATLVSSVFQVNAYAWGEREQQALIGFAAGLLAPKLFEGIADSKDSSRFSNTQADRVYQPRYEPKYQPRLHRADRYRQHRAQTIIIEDAYGNRTFYKIKGSGNTIVIKR